MDNFGDKLESILLRGKQMQIEGTVSSPTKEYSSKSSKPPELPKIDALPTQIQPTNPFRKELEEILNSRNSQTRPEIPPKPTASTPIISSISSLPSNSNFNYHNVNSTQTTLKDSSSINREERELAFRLKSLMESEFNYYTRDPPRRGIEPPTIFETRPQYQINLANAPGPMAAPLPGSTIAGSSQVAVGRVPQLPHPNVQARRRSLIAANGLGRGLGLGATIKIEQVDLDETNDEDAELRNMDVRVGSKIVWFSETSEEVGTVKWLGRMNDENTAGIEFERRVGYTNGMLDNIRHFTCEPNHGRFLPVDQLILYADYFGEEADDRIQEVVAANGGGDVMRPPPRKSVSPFDPIICIICQDPLISQIEGKTQDLETVATPCGHLLHLTCIEEWFSKRNTRLCPYCNQTVPLLSLIRIYPVTSGKE